MSQQINDNYELLAALALDDRYAKATITDRDAIPSTRRYLGMLCYVAQTNTLYFLKDGILNSDWIVLYGENIGDGIETEIDGFYVLTAGKTNFVEWESGDKFRGWINDRYVVGKIVGLPVSMPADIDDTSKVKLVVDNTIF